MVAVCHDGVGRISLVRSIDIARTGNGQVVGEFRSTLRNKEIVVSVLLIYMWSLRVASAGTVPNWFAWRQLLSRLRVYLTERDMSIGIRDHPAGVALEQKAWVDALLLKPYRLAPRSFWVFGSNEEIAAVAHICSNHVVSPVVITYGRGVDAEPRRGILQRQLAFSCKHIANLFPVHEVLAVIDGYTGEILE